MSRLLTKPPTSFWAVAVLLLMSAGFGCAAYLAEVTRDMAGLPEAERAIYDATPLWAPACFAIAVWSALVASILLLLRRRQAQPFYVLSPVTAVARLPGP